MWLSQRLRHHRRGVSHPQSRIFLIFTDRSDLTWQADSIKNRPPNIYGPYQTTNKRRMRGVNLKKGEPVDRALKRLKTKLDAEGILEEMRRRRAFETPTERKQRKLRSASKRNKIRWRYSNAPAVAAAEAAE